MFVPRAENKADLVLNTAFSVEPSAKEEFASFSPCGRLQSSEDIHASRP